MHEVYRLSDEKKIHYLKHLVLGHSRFEQAARSLAAQLQPSAEASTILVGGQAGVGKTTALQYVQEKSGWARDMGFVTWPRAPHGLSVRQVVDQLARAAAVAGRPSGTRQMSLAEQRRYVPRILVIDDDVESSSCAAQRSALELFFAWHRGVGRKVVLVGNGKLGKVIADLPSVCLRTVHVQLGGYGTWPAGRLPHGGAPRAAAASAAYRAILHDVRERWPYEERPDFAERADAIYGQTRGNMARTKQFYLTLARRQASNGGKWDRRFFDD